MSRENFHRLLQRYLDGRCTPAEKQLVDHWYQMLDEDEDGEITLENVDVIEESIWDKIQNRIKESSENDDVIQLPKRTRWKNIRLWAVAASITAFLAVSAVFLYYRVICHPVQPSFAETSTPKEDIVTIVNNTPDNMPVVLPDASLVKLYPGATLKYPRHFKGDREVKLVGDAVFTVEADPENPFWVFHEGMITKVIGTKFKITAPKGNSLGEVVVYTGKVDVFYNDGNRNLVRRIFSAPEKTSITANQRAVRQATSIAESIVENPIPVGHQEAKDRQDRFKDIPMPALVDTLSNLYALKVVADENLANITFTGDISGLGLFEQLHIICTVTNTRYEVVGTTISIKH